MARGRREYFTPDYDSTMKIAESRGPGYDSLYKESAKLLKPRKGVNLVRGLPPTWRNPVHYAYKLYFHPNIGPNDRRYLCTLKKYNALSPYDQCPVCEALYDLGASATQDDKLELRPRLTYLMYLIDRDNEKEGVQLWSTGHKNITELAIQSIDRRNRAALNITHPDEGYDFEFTRVGTGRNDTRYHGFMVSRESTPLSDSDKRYNEWLDYAFDNPIPDMLNFYKPARIEEEFYGRAKDKEDEDEDKPRSRRGNGAAEDDDEEPRRPLRRTRAPDKDDDDDAENERPSRRRPSRSDDDDVEDTKPARRARDRTADDEDDTRSTERQSRGRREDPDDEEVRPKGRSRLSEDIDDEIPSDSRRRRANGSGDDDEAEARPRRRQRLEEADDVEETRPARGRTRASADDDDDPPSTTRRRRAADDEDDAPSARRRGGADDDDEGRRHAQSRSRLRERLDRSA